MLGAELLKVLKVDSSQTATKAGGGSLTFSVTPRTLMASVTCWWMFVCISSSHTHRPRLHTAMHLNDTSC